MKETASARPGWRRFTGPYHLMVTLLVGSYLGMPFVEESLLGGLTTLALLCLALLVGIRAAGGSPWNMRAAWGVLGLMALGTTGVLVGLDASGSHPFGVTLRVSTALLILIGVKASLSHTLSPGRVDTDKIFAAIGALFLLALFWGYLYLFLDESVLPDQALFSGAQDAEAGLRISARQTELVYFSIITLTTVGYGDIAPIHPVSRSLASLEGLTGQLYLTVLVARLVALHISHSSEDRAG